MIVKKHNFRHDFRGQQGSLNAPRCARLPGYGVASSFARSFGKGRAWPAPKTHFVAEKQGLGGGYGCNGVRKRDGGHFSRHGRPFPVHDHREIQTKMAQEICRE